MTNPFYSFLLFISGIISCSIAIVAWTRRPVAGAVPLAYTMVAMVFWGWMYAISWLTPGINAKIFWLGLAFFGVATSSPAFLTVAIEFTGHQDWLTRKFFIGIFTLPALAMFMYITDPWFGLFFGGMDITAPNDFMRGGPGFGLLGLNGYFCTFSSAYLFIRYYLTASAVKRSSIVIILVGTFFPFFGTLVSLFHLSPFPGLDLTPLLFSISGMFYAYGLFTYRMMDLAPIGREAVLEKMEDGMLVVDDVNRVVDLNPRARSFLDKGIGNPIGHSVMNVFSTWAREIHFDFMAQSDRTHVQVEGPDFYHYDILITTLFDSRGDIAGRLFVWRDISAQKKSEIEVHEVNLDLKRRLMEIELLHAELRELAVRDTLTGLFNRGYMEETLDREFARAIREKTSLSVMMIDVDKFKMVNDTFGHQAGDVVLQTLGDLLMKNIRMGDIACRYGGDEMLVVMPNASLDDASLRAKKIAQIFSELRFDFNSAIFQTTLSIGVASFPTYANTVAELLQVADKALYSAKNKRSANSI